MGNSVVRKNPHHASGFGTPESLYAPSGKRKYLNTDERKEALAQLRDFDGNKALFVQTLAWTGARISEVLALRATSFQLDRALVAFMTLKRRRGVVREVPLPPDLVAGLEQHFGLRAMQRDPIRAEQRLWPWHRVTAWRLVKSVMAEAGIIGPSACPRGFRHGFGVAALQSGVPLMLLQRWLGHARMTTTAIYTEVSGPEERFFASRIWSGEIASVRQQK